MQHGFVYVMVSSSRDRLIKIGGTKNHPNERARDLNTTGVPFDWIVAYYEAVSDWPVVEQHLHVHFADRRRTQHREFFEVDPREATEWLRQFARLYPCSKGIAAADEQSGTDADGSKFGTVPQTESVANSQKLLSRYIRIWCDHCGTYKYTSVAPDVDQAACPTCAAEIQFGSQGSR